MYDHDTLRIRMCDTLFTACYQMLHRIYDLKHVEENLSFTTYLGKFIIGVRSYIVLLQPLNMMYLPGIKVSDDIVSLCGDGPG